MPSATSTTAKTHYHSALPDSPADDITIMVSSTVGGQEERLSQIRTVLKTLGYEVWMSMENPPPIDPRLSNLENCLNAVDQADILLILINWRYGSLSSNSSDGLSVFHEEVRRAVDEKKLRFVYVHEKVDLAKKVLKQFDSSGANAPWSIPSFDFEPVQGILENLRVLDIYDYVLEEHLPQSNQSKWVQTFSDTEALLEAVHTQFENPERIAALIDDQSDSTS